MAFARQSVFSIRKGREQGDIVKGMEQNGSKKRRNPWGILAIVFAVAACVCIGFLIKTSIDSKRRADEMSDLVKIMTGTEISNPTSSEPSQGSEVTSTDASTEPTASPEPVDPFEESIKLAEKAGVPIPDLEVDLKNLQETVNADIYAWIYVPGTKVNYPVLQHPTDDSYYLNYNLDGSKGYPGCIYTEKTYNNKEFTDHNTVLYGHNMKNGTMFGSLHKYEDEDFFYENRYVYVYTQDRLLVYKIFAAYDHSNEHLLYNNNFSTPQRVEYYYECVKEERSMHYIFDESVELSGEEHFITLSTCINNRPENRFLVQGVLINEE